MRSDLIMAAGATIAMLGIIARGLAASQRRVVAMRKQHELDERKPGESVRPEPHFEKHLGHYANGVIALGLVLIAIGALR